MFRRLKPSFAPFAVATFALIPALSKVANSQVPLSDSKNEVLGQGLKIWRKSGAIEAGAACATCHSPDGIELAEYRFNDADIVRRATPHVGADDAQRLVAYVHALRAKLGIARLKNPDLDRPLQPGGRVLPGKTAGERDFAFGKELEAKLPRFFSGRIESIDQAKSAERELLDLPPQTLRIGIPLNRLSEDVEHGPEHSSIAQWLPEVPPIVSPSDIAEWYRAEDEYLAHPSPEELHKLLVLHIKLVNTNRMPGLSALSAFKFRALLVLQDRMRHREEKQTGVVSPEVAGYGNYNPLWQVGEFARDMVDRNPQEIGMAPDLQQKKLVGPSLTNQLHELRASWFWAGWLSDQGLFKTSHDDKTRLGMWFSESLSKDGPYPIHNVYANARRQAVVSNDIQAWGEPLARRRRIWDMTGLRSFQAYRIDIPKGAAYRKLYLTFTENCFRMNLLLLDDDLRRTGQVWIKLSTKANVDELAQFIVANDPSGAIAATRLKNDLFQRVDAATERR
jgi:hypothetical protein